MAHQPAVTDYFNVIKRKQTIEGEMPQEGLKLQRQKPESRFELQEEETVDTVNQIEPLPVHSAVSKPPTLTRIDSRHITSIIIDESEITKRFCDGPPRLTPFKNGIPVPNSPLRDYKRQQSPIKAPGSGSPFKAQVVASSSPSTAGVDRFGSPIKQAPDFASKSVVKKLFGIANEGEAGIYTTSPQLSLIRIPAYQKYAHLVAKNDCDDKTVDQQIQTPEFFTTTLSLPFKYKVLEEVFQAVETVASLLYNRQEPITFSKLKIKVYDLLPKPLLHRDHISQTLTVLPNSYDLTWIHNELVITPKLKKSSDACGVMDTLILMDRRRTFHQNLIGICYRHHQNFLASLFPPIEIPAGKPISRWHPKFALDNVPDVTLTALPSNPTQSVAKTSPAIPKPPVQKFKTVKAELKKARQKLIEIRNSKSVPPSSTLLKHITRTISKDSVKHDVQTISKALLDRIRARERLQAIRSMTLSTQECRDRELLIRLPQYVRMVRNAILVEKKNVVPLCVLTQRLVNSQSQGFRESEVEEHLRLIEKIVPDWLRILTGTQGLYVKIDRDVDINGIIDQVEVLIRKSGETLFKCG